MHGLSSYDGKRKIDWGNTSTDYSSYRPGPPPSFYSSLKEHGIGISNQRILDLGTGTGVLARQFSRQGCKVIGLDISEEQIEKAKVLAEKEHLDTDFHVSSAEDLSWCKTPCDVATANQCWLYFDKRKVITELKRVLAGDRLLVTSHFSWLPQKDHIAEKTEKLILQFNPDWSAANYSGIIPEFPEWPMNTLTWSPCITLMKELISPGKRGGDESGPVEA